MKKLKGNGFEVTPAKNGYVSVIQHDGMGSDPDEIILNAEEALALAEHLLDVLKSDPGLSKEA